MKPIFLTSILIATSSAAFANCKDINCESMAKLNPAIESEFILPSGYQMIPANLGDSYSWGGHLFSSTNTTELCCSDADQFFYVINPGNTQRCLIDSGIDANGQSVTAKQRNYLDPSSKMNCQISGSQVSSANYRYKITIS